MSPDAEYWIDKLGLSGHPEGGYFRETYRSAEAVGAHALPERHEGQRAFQTAIHFLLKSDQRSALHRMASDEIWFFHAGSPAVIYCLFPDGRREDIRLGPHTDRGEVLQAVIPHGVWFGAEVIEPDSYVLVSCTVAPGFEFADFRLGGRGELVAQFPHHVELIDRMATDSDRKGDS
ncbi:cupin domain-containing protein [Thiohalorhabdus sp.]|uniref:cupin domain-containing protein n=1 Tax=Thiohalorhabdus sp. TaxID=3094134 RepID=UPI002FC37868